MTTNSVLVGLVASLVLGLACQNENNGASSVKSLDNVEAQASGQAETTNVCSGDFEVNGGLDLPAGAVRGARTQELKLAVSKALTSIPSSLSFAFFALDGTIDLRDDAAAICGGDRGPVSANAGEDLSSLSCLKIDPKANVLSVVIAPSEKAIFHGMTRAFGVFYSQGLASAVVKNGVPTYEGPTADVKDTWVAVKAALISELPASLSADGRRFVDQLPPLQVYAEAFDSQYCSGRTRDAAKKYPKTMRLFEPTVDQLDALDQALATALRTSNLDALRALGGLSGMQARARDVVVYLAEQNLQLNKSAPQFGLATKSTTSSMMSMLPMVTQFMKK